MSHDRLHDMVVLGGSRALTPEELGRVFASLGSDEQAQFWNGVAAATKEWPDGKGYSYGELQWCAGRKDLLRSENSEGLAVLQSMCAFVLFHAWREMESRR